MGLAALLSLWLYGRSFDWVEAGLHVLARNDQSYALYNVLSAGIAMLIMAPAAFFAGMTLPLFTLALLRAGSGETGVGRIYAANTLGAIVGVLLGVHLLLPGLGLKLAMIAAAAADLLLGVVLLRRARTEATPWRHLVALGLAGLALAVTLRGAAFDPARMAAGVYRTGRAGLGPDERVPYYRDGKTASVAIVDHPSGQRRIATNGKPDASIQMIEGRPPSPDEATMVMIAALSLGLHPAPRHVANIGFGSGMSTSTLLADPRVERVDTIEFERAMIEGARAFGSPVARAYTDPRSHLHIDDAKTYFSTHDARYDVILSEPSNPWVSGIANLFTTEFYRFIPRHLEKGGLFVQWLQLYGLDDELVGSVLNALGRSFRDYCIYLSNDLDMLIVAPPPDDAIRPVAPSLFEPELLRDSLAGIGVRSLDDLHLHELGSRRTLEPLFAVASARINSDFHPILSLEAPRMRFSNRTAIGIEHLSEADVPILELTSDYPCPRVLRRSPSRMS